MSFSTHLAADAVEAEAPDAMHNIKIHKKAPDDAVYLLNFTRRHLALHAVQIKAADAKHVVNHPERYQTWIMHAVVFAPRLRAVEVKAAKHTVDAHVLALGPPLLQFVTANGYNIAFTWFFSMHTSPSTRSRSKPPTPST